MMLLNWDPPTLGYDSPGMLLDLDGSLLGFSPGMQKQKRPRDWGKAENEDALLLP